MSMEKSVAVPADIAALVADTINRIVDDCQDQKLFLGTVNARAVIRKHVTDALTAAYVSLAAVEKERDASVRAYEAEKEAADHYRTIAARKSNEKIVEFNRAEAAEASLAEARKALAEKDAALECEPTGEMMDAVRHIVQWLQGSDRPTERGLFTLCRVLRKPTPKDCRDVDHVPSARLIAYWIWTGMFDAALRAHKGGADHG